MSSSRKKKTRKQLKTYLAILLPALAVLLLLALILTLGQFAPSDPEETEPTDPGLPENPYSASDFEYQNGYLTCTAADARLVIDVSEHQPDIDWKQVKAAGIDYVMIRAGYRGYTEGKLFLDGCFDRHFAGARAAGLEVGIYFFSQATTPEEAKEEADFLLSVLRWRKPELGIAYDWEFVSSEARTGATDGATVTDCAIAFCDAVAAAGHRPWVYFNPYQVENGYDLEQLTKYDFWLAMYTEEMTFPWQVDMWQYTGEGAVPGIPVPVDLNLLFP